MFVHVRPRPSRSRPPARRRLRIVLESLERRELLAVTPTDHEQYMLALINRARANPAAEGQRLLAIAQTDPVIKQATSGWDLGEFVQMISGYGPLPPLAFNTRLIEAARAQDARMLAQNSQRHSPNGFLTNAAVAKASDGQAYYNVANASWATGENIFAFSSAVNANSLADYVNYFHAGFLIDWGNPDYGHLKNLMTPGPSAPASGMRYSEIGIGLLTDAFPTAPPDPNPPNPGNAGLNVGPALVTQEFGWRSTSPAFLTGIMYTDRDRDGFYTPGEGMGGVTVKATGRNGQGSFQVSTWGSGGYSLALPPGTYDVSASGGSLAGLRTTAVTIGPDNVAWDLPILPDIRADIPLAGDFDGDGKSDLAVFRADTAEWIYRRSSDGSDISRQFGWAGVDVPVPGRYDGGAASRVAVYRTTTAEWFISGTAVAPVQQFGWAGVDVPVPADYDGDGKTDLAVYRPPTAQWFIRRSSDNASVTYSFGWPGVDQPVVADYDGDGKADVAVYRPPTAQWFIRRSGDGGSSVTQFGWPGVDEPAPARYDGDGKADIAVFRPLTAEWFILPSSTGVSTRTAFGWGGVDLAVPADYDGDGRADLAVYRPTTARWFLRRSRDGALEAVLGQGGSARTFASTFAKHSAVPAAWLGWKIPAPAGKVEMGPQSAAKAGSRRGLRVVPQGPAARFARVSSSTGAP